MSLGVGRCRFCGEVVAYDAKVCPSCGAAHPAGPPPIWSHVANVLVIAGLLGGVIWSLIFVQGFHELAAKMNANRTSHAITPITAAVNKLFDGVDQAMGKPRK